MLLAVFNMRLGQWLLNPSAGKHSWMSWIWRHVQILPWPTLPMLLADHLLFDAEDRAWCLVTDGGHSENLGLWALLQRRCKLIVVSDAGEDPRHSFEDFLKVCRRVRLFHGVEVLDLHDKRPIDLQPLSVKEDDTCRYHFFIGRVLYPDDYMPDGVQPRTCKEGYIIYLKPSLTKDEENDLLRHFHHRQPFPHDPTVNQFYDPDMVESYRQLGFHIGRLLCSQLPENLANANRIDVEELFWNHLRHGPLYEVLHGSDGENRQQPPPEGKRDAVLRRLRRYDTDEVYRRAVAEEVRQILERHREKAEGGTGWRGPAMTLTAEQLAEWAVACNHRILRHDAPRPTGFTPAGRQNLIEMTVMLEGQFPNGILTAAQFAHLGQFAVQLSTQVFVEGGPETARMLILCLLTVFCFVPTGVPPGGLLERLAQGDAEVTDWLHVHYPAPQV